MTKVIKLVTGGEYFSSLNGGRCIQVTKIKKVKIMLIILISFVHKKQVTTKQANILLKNVTIICKKYARECSVLLAIAER